MWVVSISVFYNLFGDQIVFREREIFHMVVHALKKGDFFSKKKSFWPVSHLYSMHWNIGNIQVFTKLLAQREAVKQKWHLSVMSKDFNLGKLEWKRWPKKNFLLSQYASKCFVCLGVNILMKSHFYSFYRYSLPSNKCNI